MMCLSDDMYGSECLPCPDCGDMGTCDSGYFGTGVCNCLPGWTSSAAPCDSCASGFYGPNCTACPNCGSHGSCDDGFSSNGACVCDLGWSNQTGQCNSCASGFVGKYCTSCVNGTYPNCYVAIPCPNSCSGLGTCNFVTGICACNPGFAGPDCTSCLFSGYVFPQCPAQLPCPMNCSNNGQCDGNSGACICNTGYDSSGCDECADGYEGYPDCYLPESCSYNCSDRGECDNRTAQCICDSPFTGYGCLDCLPGFEDPDEGCWPIISCPAINCSNHGICNPRNGTCECNPGFTGNGCETELYCYFTPCTNGGTCHEGSNTFICSCPAGFDGVSCQYAIIMPMISSISPSIASQLGTNISVIGSDLQSPLTVQFLYGSMIIGTVYVTDFAFMARKRSYASFWIETPVTNLTGYVNILVTNPSGLSITYSGLYITDECPETGEFYNQGNCSNCPTTAYCPGGDRLWPIPGTWSPDSQTVPYPCPPPASRCTGNLDSPCAEGYQGELCAFCQEGYQVVNTTSNVCESCTNGVCPQVRELTASLYFYLICVGLIVFFSLSYVIYRGYKRMKHKMESNPVRRRLSQRIRGLKNKKGKKGEGVSEQEIVFLTEDHSRKGSSEYGGSSIRTSTSYGSLSSFDVPDNLSLPPSKSPSGTLSKSTPYNQEISANNNSPLNDAEAVCLDCALRAIPLKEALYTQILKTERTDLVFARIAHQVANKIMHNDQKLVVKCDEKGALTGLADEAEIQRLVDKYLDLVAWKIVGAVNAIGKGSFADTYQRPPFELPYSVEVFEDKGTRVSMENRWFIQLYANELMGFGMRPNVSIIGIYDGFNGTEAADYVARHLHINLIKNEYFKTDPYWALSQSFQQTQTGFKRQVQLKNLSETVGATAVLAMIRGSSLWFAWLGDCQAVLFKTSGEYIGFCEPQTADRPLEKKRIEAKGGVFVERGGILRLGGLYSVTRAFGCTRMSNFLIAEPEVISYELQGDEEFLVVANNGFWSAVNYQVVGGFLTQFTDTKVGIAEALTQYARRLGSPENITISVLSFHD